LNLHEIYVVIASVAIPVLLGYAAFCITLGIRWWKNIPHNQKLKELGILALIISAFCFVSVLAGNDTKVTVMIGALSFLIGMFIRAKPIDLSFLGDRNKGNQS